MKQIFHYVSIKSCSSFCDIQPLYQYTPLTAYHHRNTPFVYRFLATISYLRPLFDRLKTLGDQELDDENLPGVPSLTSSDLSEGAVPNPLSYDALSDCESDCMNSDAFACSYSTNKIKKCESSSEMDNDVLSYSVMKRALSMLTTMNGTQYNCSSSDEILISDSQFMLVLATVVKNSEEGEGGHTTKGENCRHPQSELSFPEFLQCYKIIIGGMQMLKRLPVCDATKDAHPSFRTRAKARTNVIMDTFGTNVELILKSTLIVDTDTDKMQLTSENASFEYPSQKRGWIFPKKGIAYSKTQKYGIHPYRVKHDQLHRTNTFLPSWKLILMILFSIFLLYSTKSTFIPVRCNIFYHAKRKNYVPFHLKSHHSITAPSTRSGRIFLRKSVTMKEQQTPLTTFLNKKIPTNLQATTIAETYLTEVGSIDPSISKQVSKKRKTLILSNIFSTMSGTTIGILIAQKAHVSLHVAIHPIAVTLIVIGSVTLNQLRFHEHVKKLVMFFQSKFFNKHS